MVLVACIFCGGGSCNTDRFDFYFCATGWCFSQSIIKNDSGRKVLLHLYSPQMYKGWGPRPQKFLSSAPNDPPSLKNSYASPSLGLIPLIVKLLHVPVYDSLRG